MEIIIASTITFFSTWIMLKFMPPQWLRRIVGKPFITNVLLHGSILWLFFGTSTLGLLQAELTGIFLSIWLAWYRWSYGYEEWSWKETQFIRYAGRFTRHVM